MRTLVTVPILSEAHVAAIWNSLSRFHGGEPMKPCHLYFARRVDMAARLLPNARQFPEELQPFVAPLASAPWEDAGQGPDTRIQIGPLDVS